MFGRPEDDDPASMFARAYLEAGQAFEESDVGRIANVLRENLDLNLIPHQVRICCLGVGEGIEALALRKVFPDAEIILGVDTELPTRHGLDCIKRAGAKFECADAGNMEKIVELLGDQQPDLVICRNPNIYRVVRGKELVLSGFEDERASILGGWARIMTALRRQLLVTTYFAKDRDFLAEFMKSIGIDPIIGESAYENPVPEFDRWGMKTDGYILKV